MEGLFPEKFGGGVRPDSQNPHPNSANFSPTLFMPETKILNGFCLYDKNVVSSKKHT